MSFNQLLLIPLRTLCTKICVSEQEVTDNLHQQQLMKVNGLEMSYYELLVLQPYIYAQK